MMKWFKRVDHAPVETRPGAPEIISFMGDKFRLNEGPKMVKMRLDDASDIAAELRIRGVPIKYIEDGKDALGAKIEPGADLHFWAFSDRAGYVWHFYAREDDRFQFKGMIPGTKDEAIAAAVKKIKELI